MSLIRTLAKVCGLLIGLIVAIVVVMVILEKTGMDRISRERERELEPIIQFMDRFIKDTGRLPSHDEFHRTADSMAWMVVLRTKDHPYAARKGAKTELDYMAGIWRADWYHYYKSWDHKFINAADETADMMNGRGEAQADTEMLKIALLIYQKKHGELPFIPAAGSSAPVYASGSQQNVYFANLSPNQVSPAGEFLDPWEHPFTFRLAGDRIVVSSAGPDGRPQTADDISSHY